MKKQGFTLIELFYPYRIDGRDRDHGHPGRRRSTETVRHDR